MFILSPVRSVAPLSGAAFEPHLCKLLGTRAGILATELLEHTMESLKFCWIE
jgi:hypothetical protein